MNTNIEPVELRSEVMTVTVTNDSDNKMMNMMSESSEISAFVVQQPPTKKVKKERDPNQPKKPLNNYFLFQRDFRARFKESHPSATSAELTKMMNEAWEKMTREEADYYDNLAKEHSAVYLKALEEYNNKKKQEVESSESVIADDTIPSATTTDHTTTDTIPVFITPTPAHNSSDTTETPRKKKKKNKEKHEKHSE